MLSRRRSGGSCTSGTAAFPHGQPRGSGERGENLFLEMAQGTGSQPFEVLLATGLRRIFYRSQGFKRGDLLHRRTGETSPDENVSGRIPELPPALRDRIRRTLRLGLGLN